MTSARRAKPSSRDFLSEGNEAFLAGRFYLAAEAFAKALQADPRNPVVLFNLASAKERVGEIEDAARLLSEALHRRPVWFEPAQRLALLLGRYRLSAPEELDPHGLLAAFAFDRIDSQPVASTAIAHLRATSPLGDAVAEAEQGRADAAARALLLRRTDKILTQPLFLAALASSAILNPGLERLLTSLRRVLLMETPAERFEDKALTAFVLALIRQCLHGEYVWPVSEEERQRLTGLPVDWAALRGGVPDQARRLMLHLLYAPPQQIAGSEADLTDWRALRPRGLGELLAERFEADRHEAGLATDIPALSAIEDATSRKVAGQYEAHPYPRWTNLPMPREGSARGVLERFFPAQRLTFLDRRFRVLIAGAGTGRHALAAAVRYGPQADLVAVDLSRRSLAYAKAKAEHFGIGNIRFAQADLLTMPTPDGKPFDIIEAVGVLHHMAEPFKGWSMLLPMLRPGGVMLTGLYSAVARRNIAALRSEADYPEPGCDDDRARAYRAGLMERDDEAASLSLSQDFYTLSDFRDLVLHEHERPIFLSEIEAFLAQHRLIFRGFNLPQPIIDAFLAAFSHDRWPGTLANWAAYEEREPRIFDAMYQIWCEKVE